METRDGNPLSATVLSIPFEEFDVKMTLTIGPGQAPRTSTVFERVKEVAPGRTT